MFEHCESSAVADAAVWEELERLVRSVLLEERAGERGARLDATGGSVWRWRLVNECDAVMAVRASKYMVLEQVERVLDRARRCFVERYAHRCREGVRDEGVFDDFREDVAKLLAPQSETVQVAAEASGSGGATAVESTDRRVTPAAAPPDRVPRASAAAAAKNKPAAQHRVRRKEARKWDTSAATAEELQALDYSTTSKASATTPASNTDDSEALRQARARYLEAAPSPASAALDALVDDADEPEDATEEERPAAGDAATSKPAAGLLSYFSQWMGNRPLSREDLQAPLTHFREKLIAKNVAPPVAEALTRSVAAKLEGKRLDAFTVRSMVRTALQEALSRTLTPRQTQELVDAIRQRAAAPDMAAANGTTTTVRHRRPYIMVFVGVNGVGKSTTLAKVCHYLQSHGLTVFIAACDTFRAGAVEQLRIHARCLGVELYDRGYGKDSASVATEAIRQAQEHGADVVLVDTAGRMQNNEPLMRALAKLVTHARPDRVLFVGEALVGNEAVDQLQKFQQALVDFQPAKPPRCIDGIVLTKFDTVDDKVGAAVSMVYTTAQPIVFVGVGQTYRDLRPMDVSLLVRALLR
ncbi:hypothetical protein CDCA_CDCA14G3756 [Cyanidium caldarium]|uniref:SRP54-type proteins GTP-binding domain-containing protein n=1 Tax=Cyanidium caldarium TaxID=2771 RepID=A0AAV9J0B7_CYACA|nr:hypothetical protein CDCA_CDCA14G3756 [Cyanidium caldarium]